MTLSEDEQNSLDEIETSFHSDDPDFATSLDVVAVQRSLRRRIRLAGYGFWLGMVVMMLGVAVAKGALSIGTIVGCYGFIVLVWSAATILRCRSLVPASTSPYNEQ
jgi:hypothetical protein